MNTCFIETINKQIEVKLIAILATSTDFIHVDHFANFLFSLSCFRYLAVISDISSRQIFPGILYFISTFIIFHLFYVI